MSILRTAAVLEHEINDTLKPFGLTHTQYNVLRILRGAGSAGLCGREIGERLVTPVPDVPRLLERMTAAGLIARTRDREDKRHVASRITAKGRRMLERVQAPLEAIGQRRTGSLGAPDVAALLRHLDTVRSGT